MTKVGSSFSVSALISRIVSALPILIAAGCFSGARYKVIQTPPPAPEVIWRDCWKRLGAQRSFRFAVSYQAGLPLDIKAQYSGRWAAPDREYWNGSLIQGGVRRAVRLVAIGERQYQFDGDSWRVEVRGVESRIVEQLRQVLRDPSPALEEQTSRLVRFRFRPELPLLDPAGLRTLTGTAEFDAATGLPLAVSARDATGSIECSFRFWGFNQPLRVDVPFVAEQTAVLAAKRFFFDCCRLRRILRQRLEAMGWETRIKASGRQLIVESSVRSTRSVVELLSSRGWVEVWACREPERAAEREAAAVVGSDASRRVILERRIAANRALETTVLEPVPVSTVLRVILPTDGLVDAQMVALVLDGAVLAVTRSGPDGRADFDEIGSRETVRAIAALAQTDPLPVKLVLRSLH